MNYKLMKLMKILKTHHRENWNEQYYKIKIFIKKVELTSSLLEEELRNSCKTPISPSKRFVDALVYTNSSQLVIPKIVELVVAYPENIANVCS